MHEANFLNGCDDLFRERGDFRDGTAHAPHGGGDGTAANGKDGGHDLHAVTNGDFGSGEADEMAQNKLRALKVPEGCCRVENAHGKEQNQQAVADAYKGGVDVDDDIPYLSALEALWGLCDETPKLRELFVPSANGVFQRVDYPVVINVVYLLECVTRSNLFEIESWHIIILLVFVTGVYYDKREK